MSQQHLPDPTRVAQTVSKSRHHRRALELAFLEFEALISQLEQENRQRRGKYLIDFSSNQ